MFTTKDRVLEVFTIATLGMAGLTSVAESALVETQLIAFVSNRDGHIQIYTIYEDGSGEQPLTQGLGGNNQPDWSPDGQRIVFTSTRDGKANPEIYVMNADGSGQKRLTNHLYPDWYPSWSPDGQQIAFFSARDGHANLYVMDVESGRLTALTQTLDDKGPAKPIWSPDGKKLAFIGQPKGTTKNQIFVVNTDGSGLRDISSHISKDAKSEPAWSPDGAAITFSVKGRGFTDLWKTDMDGANPVNLTGGKLRQNYSARWSRDGKRIAFVSTRADGVRSNIFIMDADGSNPTNLSQSPTEDFEPRWLADGKTLVFVSLRTGTAQLFSVQEGVSPRRLTWNTAHDLEPTPQPRHTRIALNTTNAQ